MADNRMKNAPILPATGPNAVNSDTQAPPDPPRGNAADPTSQVTIGVERDSGLSDTGTHPDQEADLHTVGADPTRHGALGKTDVNVGHDAPIDAGAEGLNIDEFNKDEAA